MSSVRENFISKYKPYYLQDFSIDMRLLSVIKTLLEMDDPNILVVGGPSSGKTTLLYSILREYYGYSKEETIPETNILFINNLKEQGIHYFRNDMKTFCQSHSTIYGKKKMIVIDDLDTINEQCQQVFRNYIDKYRNNIHFISVCTNIQKVIESIQSRVHIIRLTTPTIENIKTVMTNIIERENLFITDEAKEHLIHISNHSLRDMINHLEKIYIYGEPIDKTVCIQLCSTIPCNSFDAFIRLLEENRLMHAIQTLYEIHDKGYSVIDILYYFYNFIKTTDILTEETKYKIIPYTCKYITLFNKLHENIIELAFFTNNLYENIFFRENVAL
jgi:DNA polymerase III delta prime subunit|uniref:ATPase AAA-type core domain-containing protein n=1 Tax=viral metagenome TaxID=1070528 RepID=A0A6C0DYM8_9ZZZZ